MIFSGISREDFLKNSSNTDLIFFFPSMTVGRVGSWKHLNSLSLLFRVHESFIGTRLPRVYSSVLYVFFLPPSVEFRPRRDPERYVGNMLDALSVVIQSSPIVRWQYPKSDIGKMAAGPGVFVCVCVCECLCVCVRAIKGIECIWVTGAKRRAEQKHTQTDPTKVPLDCVMLTVFVRIECEDLWLQ